MALEYHDIQLEINANSIIDIKFHLQLVRFGFAI